MNCKTPSKGIGQSKHMNIFAISNVPLECATCLDDLRLNKMIVESAQILSTVLRGTTYLEKERLYKATHTKHPCVKWAGESCYNAAWLDDLLFFMLKEWEFRMGKKHAVEGRIYRRLPHHRRMSYYDLLPTGADISFNFVNCTPYKDMEVRAAYRKTLCEKWKNDLRPPRWTRRGQPTWRTA